MRHAAIGAALLLGNGLSSAASPRKTAPPAVRLTLEVHRRQLRPAEPLFVRLTLRNAAARGEMLVSDRKYRGGDALYRDWIQAAEGLGLDYIELIGPNGKPVPVGRYDELGPATRGPLDITIGEADADVSSRAAALSAQGLSPEEVTRRLNEWQHRETEKNRWSLYPSRRVPPGASLRTVSFCVLKSGCPGKGFAQLPFDLSEPGRYRIRAVYAHEPVREEAHEVWDVRTESSWVEFEVRP